MTVFTMELRLLKALARVVQTAILFPDTNEKLNFDADSFLTLLGGYGRPLRISLSGRDVVVEHTILQNLQPVDRLLVRTLRGADWEGLRLSPSINREGILAMARALTGGKRPPLEGAGWNVDFLTFDSLGDADAANAPVTISYLYLLSQAREAIYSVAAGDPAGIKTSRAVVEAVAERVKAGADIFGSVRSLRKFDEYTYTHGLNAAIFAYAAGRALGIPEPLLIEIAMGALCHDVGKEKIPKDILHKPSRFTEDDMRFVKRHPLLGARILTRIEAPVPALMPVIAYEHHMRLVEGGYPDPLPGHAPHPASMLVAISDVIDALRTTLPYRKAYDVTGAFTVILAEARAGKFDKRFLPAFAAVLGIAGPGMGVKLTNGKLGVIAEANSASPLKPVVTAETERLDLASATGVGIAGFFEPEIPPDGQTGEC